MSSKRRKGNQTSQPGKYTISSMTGGDQNPEDVKEASKSVARQDAYIFVGMISLPDLGHHRLTDAQLVELAKRFNRTAAMELLARFNFYLSLAQLSLDRQLMIQTQEKLTSQVLLPERLQEITEIFAGRDLHKKWILLHRAQLLVGIKLIALYGREEGGNSLQNDQERAEIGELALAVNSCYGPDLGEPNYPLGEIIAQLAAGTDLTNLPLIVYGLVRTRMLLGPVLRDYLATLMPESWPPPFERVFTLLNGLNFRDFLDITLYLYAEQVPMLSEALEAGMWTYLDTNAPKHYLSGKKMKAWAELMAVDHEKVRDQVEGSEKDSAFFFDFSIFRRFPLWRADDHRYFCIDGMFLTERLSSFGFYWVVINGLVDEDLRGRFQQVWGELIQTYVRDLLRQCCKGNPAFFIRKPTYADDGTEVFDSAVVYSDSLIAIEIKSCVIPIGQKYAGKEGPFFDGLSAKFGSGESAAAEQLLRNIKQIFAAHGPRETSSIRMDEIQEVFPLAVIHEPALQLGPAAHAIIAEFMSGLSKLILRANIKVHPLQLIEIEELEQLEPFLADQDFTLSECLRAKEQEDPNHLMGLWHFVSTRFLQNRHIAMKANERLLGVFGWLSESAEWRVYRGDYFDPALGSRGQPSERALVCARPVGGDELLADEVLVFSEHENLADAYRAIEELRANGVPQQKIVADGFECAVVDEFGSMLAPP